ncbi:hypothetical protein OSB04_028185 [Centaurea solstitialis]|uniref:Uncharacterized protein n=1 Tax=Centaurea solstitialis TaxID=347529 RepID=A0AA38SF20_9ASTR|nr:hypothetical protein OSB04_028185 [Centaurea solstitialis]
MIKNNELVEDEDDIRIRSFMWRKAHETKDGEYKDDDVNNVAEEIISHEKEIAKGSVKRDQCVDALTLVFGKDHSGRVRGLEGESLQPNIGTFLDAKAHQMNALLNLRNN